MKAVVPFLLLLGFAVIPNTEGATFREARLSEVIQDVRLLSSNAAARQAVVNDKIGEGTAVRTGAGSRAELTFADLTITRLGENTIFSLNESAREIHVEHGSILLEVPPKSAAAKITSAAVTAGVQGGTALFGTGPPTKFLVLEGIGTFYPNGHPEEAVTLHGGEMVMLTADGHLTKPQQFDVKTVVETSALIVDFPDLANLPLILDVMNQQQTEPSAPGAGPPALKDIIDVLSIDIVSNPAASPPPPPPPPPPPTPPPSPTPPPTPSPSPSATPSKFGTPSTIASPDPYVISSGTQIQTDPSITTNGVTDFGKLYRGTALDGTPSEYLFGEAPTAFDQMVFSGSQNHLPIAVFKFAHLQLTGDPTITVPSGGATNLALVSVGDITSSPGGTLTFAGIPRLDFITQNGSINLGSEISFANLSHLEFYARGTGSDLTLASPISNVDTVKLNAEGSIQVNGDETVMNFNALSGVNFLAGSGTITANSVDIESLGDINIDGSKFPNPPGGGGSFVLNAANTLNVAIVGGGQPFGWDSLTATATTINLTSSTPVTFDFSNSSSVTFTAGTGGINAPNIDFVGSPPGGLSFLSGGSISIHSLNSEDATISAATSFTASGDVVGAVIGSTLTTGTTVDVGGSLFVITLTAGGNINVGNEFIALNVNAPSSILNVQGGIVPFGGPGSPQYTFNVDSIISPAGINFSFNGTSNFIGKLTINANTLTFDPATGIAFANFNGVNADTFGSGNPAEGGDGGTFIVNANGNITANSGANITATTGLNSAAGVYSGAGGSVTLLSTGGMVTVNDTIQVSSNDSSAPRQSASGGTIVLQSDLTTGQGITLGSTGSLLSLLNANAPGPGGSITLSTKGSNITVNGTITAERGTITMDQNDPVGATPVITIDGATLTSGTLNITGAGDVNIGLSNPVTMTVANDATVQILGSGAASAAIDFNGGSYNVGGTFLSTIAGDGAITFSNATVRADIVKIGVFGTNGTLTIGGGSISANTLLELYAPGSNGSIDFVSNVTLSNQSSAVIIAANKVTIFNGVVVTIGGSTDPASVFTNIANYTGFGGNGSTTGTFAGNGSTTQPLSSAPPFGGGPPVTTITYLGAPAGNWSDPTSWNPNTVPNNSGGNLYNAVQSGGTLTQDIVSGVIIQQFQMSGGTLQLSNPLTLNAGLQFSGGTIEGGNLFIAGPSTQSALMTVNGLTITNSGSYSITFDGSDIFSGSATFNNSGTLSKTTGTGTDNFNVPLNNSGTVSSENGTLRFPIGGTSAGTFSASAGATVEFASNWTFTNGTHFSGLGTIQLDNNTTTFLSGTINNSGTVLLNSTGNFTDLRIADGTTLSGGGSLLLSDSPFNRIYGTANSGTETLTNVNNTISGAGQIGVSNSIEFINQAAGVIDATSASNALIITPTTNSTLVSANGGGFVNQGLLEATAAGGLVLNGGQFNNKGAMIEAIGSGNNVVLENNVTISGGALSDSGGGLIETAAANAATLDGTSQGVLTIAGTYQVTNNSTTFLNGTINNTGTISINSGANFTDLRIADGTTLSGGGSLLLSDSPFNRIYGTANSGTETLTNVNNTISGAGQIGVSNSIEFINQSAGVINATSSTNALIITPTTNSTLVSSNGGGFVNQGLLEATAAGGLVLSGGQFNNTGGVVLADGPSSQVQIVSNTSVTGGTLRTTNGGLFSISGNAAVDQITGTLGTITVTSTGALSATNGINFNGINATVSSAPTNGGQLTLNITSGGLTIGDGNDLNVIQAKGGAYNPGGPFSGGNGGTIDITAAGDVLIQNHATDHAGISATTGTVSDVTSQYAGTGGTVDITASGQVTVDGNVKVSSDDATQNGATGSGRESASGGTIDFQSNLTTGTGITVTSSGGLFSFLNANAPGPGGSITLSTKGADIVVNGTVEADRGTVDIEHAGDTGQITFSSATVLADIVKIGAFGTNGTLNIGGGSISADTMLKLYAPSSNGTINFTADVTLGGASTKIIAGDTVNIFNGMTVTIGGANPASVFTNNANYTGSGGNGSKTGTFAGAGATTSPLSGAPPFGNALSSPTTVTPAVAVNIQTSSSTTVASTGANTAGGGQSSGPVMNFGNSAQLLSLLDAAAPGPNGQITIPFPKSASKSGNSSGTNVRNRVNTRAASEDLLRVRDRKAIRPELNNPPPTVRAPSA